MEMFVIFTSNFHADIAGDRLLRPCFLPTRLTGADVFDFLRMSFQSCCKKFDLADRNACWLLHDGVSRSFLLAVRESDKCRRGGGPTEWKATPADFKSLDIYPRGHSKFTVNATDFSSVQVWQQRTQNGSEMVRYEVWDFPASQALAVLMPEVLRWSSGWKFWGLSLILGRP